MVVPFDGFAHDGHRVDDAVAEDLGPPGGAGHQLVDVGDRGPHLPEHPRLALEHVLEAAAEVRGPEDVADAQAPAGRLVGVGRADAPLGGADAGAAASPGLLELVEERVVGHHQVGPGGDHQVVGRHPGGLDGGELGRQVVEVDHAAGADDTPGRRVEDPGRQQVEGEGSVLVDDGMTGVVSALEADDHVGVLSEPVDDPAFALVAPLGPDDDGDGHGLLRCTGRRSGRHARRGEDRAPPARRDASGDAARARCDPRGAASGPARFHARW